MGLLLFQLPDSIYYLKEGALFGFNYSYSNTLYLIAIAPLLIGYPFYMFLYSYKKKKTILYWCMLLTQPCYDIGSLFINHNSDWKIFILQTNFSILQAILFILILTLTYFISINLTIQYFERKNIFVIGNNS